MNKSIPRRTFLRGVGATVALPLLDAMVPAFAKPTATAKPVLRLGIIYAPNGMVMDKWTPRTDGANFELTPILEPLSELRNQLIVLTGLADRTADALPGEGTGDHARAGATFLTGVHPKKTEGANVRAGVSMDQIAAKKLGKETQLASLEIGLDSTEFAGACDGNYSCAYINSICWSSPTTPLPMETNPRAVFQRLFGDSDTTGPEERLAYIRTRNSILDSVTQEVVRVEKGLGSGDRAKLSEYLEAVRDVERRIQKAEEQSSKELPRLDRPPGIPDTFEQHIKMMFDLQVLAYQCDLTRVITFMIGRESTNRPYPEIGVAEAHHPLSHHQNDPQKIVKLAQINVYHSKMMGYFLEKLQATPDGDGSLLDHSMILWGGGISDPNQHLHYNLPILLAGGGADQLKPGRHIRVPEETPVTNLYLNLLDKLGVSVGSLGDSTGGLDL